ncbi:helix-turn-helix domain-containing protein [Oxalobacter formigenes]|uniref:helix-turn-helix domain-containing protein n=1 Tax=Oxalobacter formigenes TaxID=847 RepID=UPI00056289DA|nr:helix-turn-helix transcriptional regulator [Oxalobacter formigenes]ARQ46694.1 hypothetical protein BRW83_1955 [Oxalobacter formigenes]ARQ78763.1 transcriptional regulator [Oxalobacter formigenes OXCC13]MCZ4062635.1 helix-turn-helix domain-containing protein [Oxalobacter formigenes]QDX32659.1 helix-turn-helix transcriptional regulator [Oxalobacter formigenes]WAW07564.1 helix-turn-helix domain-containing protein [Oxalobacter formigenes]
MKEIDQFELLRKLRNRLGCEDFSDLWRKTGMDASGMSRIKKGKYKVSSRLFLNVATVLDISPKKLLADVGLPENYFLERRRNCE